MELCRVEILSLPLSKKIYDQLTLSKSLKGFNFYRETRESLTSLLT